MRKNERGIKQNINTSLIEIDPAFWGATCKNPVFGSACVVIKIKKRDQLSNKRSIRL